MTRAELTLSSHYTETPCWCFTIVPRNRFGDRRQLQRAGFSGWDKASLDALFGKWPGDETDKELAAALSGST